MASTDRAFRALARASPGSLVPLLRALAPQLLDVTDDEIVALDDPNLDLPPHPREADFVARVGEPALLHVECQGYRDPGFSDRVFGYHLALTLRHPERRVETCVIWLRTPSPAQRETTIRRGNVTIAHTPIVVAELPAELLLASPQTACFAPAARLGSLTLEQLCDRVVSALARAGASPREALMAAVVATSCGRYPDLVRAMERADMQPVIIEDLVDYGYEQGLEEGIEKGIERGLDEGQRAATAASVLAILEARGLLPSEQERARVLSEPSLEVLRGWVRRAAAVTTVAELLG